MVAELTRDESYDEALAAAVSAHAGALRRGADPRREVIAREARKREAAQLAWKREGDAAVARWRRGHPRSTIGAAGSRARPQVLDHGFTLFRLRLLLLSYCSHVTVWHGSALSASAYP